MLADRARTPRERIDEAMRGVAAPSRARVARRPAVQRRGGRGGRRRRPRSRHRRRRRRGARRGVRRLRRGHRARAHAGRRGGACRARRGRRAPGDRLRRRLHERRQLRDVLEPRRHPRSLRRLGVLRRGRRLQARPGDLPPRAAEIGGVGAGRGGPHRRPAADRHRGRAGDGHGVDPLPRRERRPARGRTGGPPRARRPRRARSACCAAPACCELAHSSARADPGGW